MSKNRCITRWWVPLVLGFLLVPVASAQTVSPAASVNVSASTPLVTVGDPITYTVRMTNTSFDEDSEPTSMVFSGPFDVTLACATSNCTVELPGTVNFVPGPANGCVAAVLSDITCTSSGANSINITLPTPLNFAPNEFQTVVSFEVEAVTPVGPAPPDADDEFYTRADAPGDAVEACASSNPDNCATAGAQGSTLVNFPFECNVNITKCVAVDTDGDGSLADEDCLSETTSIVGALAEWRIVATDTGPGVLSDCTLQDSTLGIDETIDLSSGPISIDVPGSCLVPETINTATVECNMCDGVGDVNTDSATATLLCEECNVQVDKQVCCGDCGDEANWFDVGLVMDATGDADDPCAGISTDPIMVRYQAANPNDGCDLTNCVLGESNPTFRPEPPVGDLASGETSPLLSAGDTPACEVACGGPDCPNEPNTVTVNCDTQFGTPVTANDDGNFSCLTVDLLVDRNVDCGGGSDDMTLVRSNEDGTEGCTTLDGNDVNWSYQAQNVGDATLYACTLTDTNLTVSGQIFVGTLAPGELVTGIPATNNPVACSTALEASEAPDLGKVDLTCCIPNVGTLGECTDLGDRVSVFDISTVTCLTPSDLNIEKACVDAEGDGADESVSVRVYTTEPQGEGFTECSVTDTFYVDNDCASGPAGDGSDVALTLAAYDLGPGADEEISTGDLPTFTAVSCNTASVTCTDVATGQSVTEDAAPVDCVQPTGGCITRTPGFWGNRPTTTAEYLPLEVCGSPIINVDPGSDESAIEAICSVGKDHKILGSHVTQLVRQCTAAALNFAVSADEGGSCGGSSTGDTVLAGAAFNACCSAESACTGVDTGLSVNECIGLIDYFNNSADTLSSDVFTGLGRADSYNCKKSRNNGVVVTPGG